ncbi:hypothetical protein [Cedecea davisae]|uniref:hypothetical protein n=1 Tax=Cedecea davisae TaxID=158484 RepID=UPI001D0BC27A|nr:hypothetical protein [Cedecea davisae]
MSSIPANSINAYQAPIKSLSNEDYVDQVGANPTKSQGAKESINTPVFVDSAVKNVITAAGLKEIAPDIPKGKIEADPINFSKQVEQLHSSFSSLSTDQITKAYTEAGKELAVLAQKSGFDITTIANGFSGRAAAILQTISVAAQQAQNIMREQASANSIVARHLGESSAKQTIAAGQANKNMVDKQAGISMAASGVSAGVQAKGLNNANKAIKVHGTKEVNLNRSADNLAAKASPGKRVGLGKENKTDVELLKKQPNNLRHDAKIETMQQQMRANDAMRMQMQGQMLGQGGQSIASLSSSSGHVEKANADAKAQINKTDENIFAGRKDSDEREQQSIAKFKADLLALLAQLLANRSNTISSMTNNIKG